MKSRGLYEQLITESLEAELVALDDFSVASRETLRRPEAGDRLALHLSRIIQEAVESLDDKERVERGLALARSVIETLARELGDESLLGEAPVLEQSVLSAILGRNPDGSEETIAPPLIPLLDTTLLTNSRGEPGVGHQLATEIGSAAQIDIVMAFIRRSGIRPLLAPLRRHCEAGRRLRVLTTTYTHSTEQRALEELQDLGAEVRVSYDTTGTRLHAKAWLFQRAAGMSTAYIGSSNLTHQAQRTGLEWNVRVSGARNISVVDKVAAVFESYWEGGDFAPFDAVEFSERNAVDSAGFSSMLSPVDIRLFPFQERLLEEIEVARERGQHQNLLVAATGTGKTVMAAVDYARLRDRLPRARLLFVAHSIDILKQSLLTFRHAIREADFGELWVGGRRPERWEHVFASIQSISSAGLDHLEPDRFDVVIVDEIHHGAAKSYSAFLDHVKPKELLGLTATPERADGLPILNWFHGRISAELRLWDAIDQNRLVPFEYYGVHDGADLTKVKFTRGTGYDVDGLTGVYTANDVWARLVLNQLEQRVDDVHAMQALGFCVGIAHAQFMARVFNEHGIAALAVWGDSPKGDREEALAKLRQGEINILFSVDLFNEGVDLPNVETLLLLRPTESPVLFLQQLGRGLRKAKNKTACLVLDFIGQHRREFRFHNRLQALLGGSRKHVEQQVSKGFPFLPAGCHMELEPVAREIVLQSIRGAVPSNWKAKSQELQSLAAEGHGSLYDYLEHSGLELSDVYPSTRSWSQLKEDAGLHVERTGPNEEQLRRACGRMLHVDDAVRLSAYTELLRRASPPTFADPHTRDARIARMLVASVCDQVVAKNESLNSGLERLWSHPQVRAELVELFDVLSNRIDHQHSPLLTDNENPLQIHARYTRIEILAAFAPEARAKVPAWQTGIRWLPDAEADVAAFTLDKTTGQFSPTTRYRDYAISPELIHWESQRVVRAESDTGTRYRNHVAQGSSMMLFARERSDDRAFWFLGPATFVKSEGEKPMAITWKLEKALPGDLFAAFAAAVG
jgi:superfamily II DNA or RNA helicase/HKD family nuclease